MGSKSSFLQAVAEHPCYHQLLQHMAMVMCHDMPGACRTIPAFEHALLVRICQLLITQLQNLLDPACEPAVQATDLRITLRVVRTVLSKFYRQLRSKCGVFIETLLAGGQGCLTGRPACCRCTVIMHAVRLSMPAAIRPLCIQSGPG